MRGAGENFVVSRDNMEQLKEQLQKAMREVPSFDKLKNHIDMTVTNEGLRIELSESATGTFFDSGSPKISGDGQDLLIALAQDLGKLPNKLALEGHTDSKPYAAASSYGNWELSTDRANAARRLMMEHGIGENQVTQVRGFADQRLRKTQDPLDPANRRISLIVQYTEKQPTTPAAAAPGAAESTGKPPDATTQHSENPAAESHDKN
jgi:chemotaxis protein MotB